MQELAALGPLAPAKEVIPIFSFFLGPVGNEKLAKATPGPG